MNRLLVLAITSLVLAACSKSDNVGGSGGAAVSGDKLKKLSQSQGAISRFGEDVKSSQTSATGRSTKLSTLNAESFSALSVRINSNTAKEQSDFDTELKQKSDKMYQKFQTSDCQTKFKTHPKKGKFNVDLFTLEVSGTQCPFRMKYEMLASSFDASGKTMKGKFVMEYQSLTEEMAKETDIRKMTNTAEFEIANDQSSTAGQETSMKMSATMSADGESVTLGAYSVKMTSSMDNVFGVPTDMSNGPGVGGSQSPANPMTMFKKILVEINYQITVGSESTALYGKVHMVEGKEIAHVTTINGVKVSDDEFNQVANSLSIPGFNPASDSSNSSSQTSVDDDSNT